MVRWNIHTNFHSYLRLQNVDVSSSYKLKIKVGWDTHAGNFIIIVFAFTRTWVFHTEITDLIFVRIPASIPFGAGWHHQWFFRFNMNHIPV
jgi:hypothetical protein